MNRLDVLSLLASSGAAAVAQPDVAVVADGFNVDASVDWIFPLDRLDGASYRVAIERDPAGCSLGSRLVLLPGRRSSAPTILDVPNFASAEVRDRWVDVAKPSIVMPTPEPVPVNGLVRPRPACDTYGTGPTVGCCGIGVAGRAYVAATGAMLLNEKHTPPTYLVRVDPNGAMATRFVHETPLDVRAMFEVEAKRVIRLMSTELPPIDVPL